MIKNLCVICIFVFCEEGGVGTYVVFVCRFCFGVGIVFYGGYIGGCCIMYMVWWCLSSRPASRWRC